jgi:hypothetical protein
VGQLDRWKILEGMITDLRGKGTVVTSETMTELTSARTLINVSKADSNCVDVNQKIDECLFAVESYLMSKGQMLFGTEYVEEWSKRLNQAEEENLEEGKDETELLPNIPRGAKWIRINPSTLPIDETKKFADELHLSCIVQNEGFLLVHGEDELLRTLVKKIATKYEKKQNDTNKPGILFSD